jgi:DNA-binding response regulator
MSIKKILLVEDEKLAREGVRDFLISRGYLVTEAVDGEEAVKKFCESGQSVFDLVILDVMLPKMNGILVLKEIRKRSKIPVLMLTALSDEGTQLASFDNLADDYLCKPFSLLILEKRIEALLRRALENPQKEGVSKWVREGVLVDFLEYKGYLNGVDVDLKPKEVELLKFLIENPKVTLRREQILEELWKDELPYDRVIDVYIKNLRKKLQIDCIKTVKGVGYCYVEK